MVERAHSMREVAGSLPVSSISLLSSIFTKEVANKSYDHVFPEISRRLNIFVILLIQKPKELHLPKQLLTSGGLAQMVERALCMREVADRYPYPPGQYSCSI